MNELLTQLANATRKTLHAIGDATVEVTVNQSDNEITITSDKAYVVIYLSGDALSPKFGIAACKTWRRNELVQSVPVRGKLINDQLVLECLGFKPKEVLTRFRYVRHRWAVWFHGFRNQLREVPLSSFKLLLPLPYDRN